MTLNHVSENIRRRSQLSAGRQLKLAAMPVDFQVVVDVRFYASGNFQAVIGDMGHSKYGSTSQSENSVSHALVLAYRRALCFPTTLRAAALFSVGGHRF